ncbi:MAG: hypothetical protein E7616_02440 [Ruminococcaceae bacterium]|nr:hypothetical protein [Oscillospiraceae bacterium]
MKQQNTKIESTLQGAFQNATPDLMDSILTECENEKGRIITMTTEKKFTKFQKSIVTAAACFAMIIGCVAGYAAFTSPVAPNTPPNNNQITSSKDTVVATTVMLDVNPSLEIKANKEEKVLDVIALNKDAELVIGDMQFEDSSLEVTVNALIDSMLQNGFINEITSSVLVSVESKNEDEENYIKDKLSAKITAKIDTEEIKGSVISQTISSEDTELAELAQTNGISLGKAKLIQKIVIINPAKEFSQYAKLSITELNNIMNASATEPDDENIYIGEEKALEIALNWRNITLEDLCAEPHISIIVSRGEVCYQIQFKEEHIIDENNYTSSTYVVYVNALTGKAPGADVATPNFTTEEAWTFVCEELGANAKNANILMKRFNNMESSLPMTYSFYFEIEAKEYVALVDAMNGVIIRIENM